MTEFFSALFRLFVLEPFQADIEERLRAAQAPPAVIRQMVACAQDATPRLAERAGNDWWWGFSTVVRVSIGTAAPEAVLIEAASSCRPAIAAARPFLTAARS